MPIYTDHPCDDGFFPMERYPLRSSIGIGPKVTKIIDAATKDWLDKHPEATTTVEEESLEGRHLKSSFSLELCRCFDTVVDMQEATDLKADMVCHTNGFHSAGDGGAGWYVVMPTGTPNGMNIISLHDGLIAALINRSDYSVILEQLGAQKNTDVTNILKFAIENYSVINIVGSNYDISETIIVPSNKSIIANNDYFSFSNFMNYTFRWIGQTSDDCCCISIQDGIYGLTPASQPSRTNIRIENILVVGNGVAYGISLFGATSNCYFDNICVTGTSKCGIVLGRSWYATYGLLVARNCTGIGVGQIQDLYSGNSSITSVHFKQIHIADITGDGICLIRTIATQIDVLSCEVCSGNGIYAWGADCHISSYYAEGNGNDIYIKNSEFSTARVLCIDICQAAKFELYAPLYIKKQWSYEHPMSVIQSGGKHLKIDYRRWDKKSYIDGDIKTGSLRLHTLKGSDGTTQTINEVPPENGYIYIYQNFSSYADNPEITIAFGGSTKTYGSLTEKGGIVWLKSYANMHVSITVKNIPSNGYVDIYYSTDCLGLTVPNENE